MGAVTNFDEFIFISCKLQILVSDALCLCLLVLHQSKINYHQLDINYIFGWMTATDFRKRDQLRKLFESLNWELRQVLQTDFRTSFSPDASDFDDSNPYWVNVGWHSNLIDMFHWKYGLLLCSLARLLSHSAEKTSSTRRVCVCCVNAQSREIYVWGKMCHLLSRSETALIKSQSKKR